MLKEIEPLADQLEMVRRELWNTVEGLTIEQLLEPFPDREWSIKDALAQLAANESLMTDVLRSIATGSRSPLADDFDNDRFMAEAAARCRDKTLLEVWQDLEESRRKLLTLLESLSPVQLERRGSHPSQGMLSVKEFLAVIYSHEASLVRAIVEQARRLRKASEPA